MEVLDIVLGEHGLAPAAPAAVPLEIAHLPEEAPAVPGVLHEISECSNVNAIDSKTPLTFEPTHITLVYGDNAVGKSSYARIIKRIARAAHDETILPNVFATSAGPPRAVIDLENENGRNKHIVPLGDSTAPLLGSMTVFDRASATIYLRKEKTVEFTPTPLKIFARAAAAQRRLRELLDERVQALASRRPNFDAFVDTSTGQALAALTAATDIAELKRRSGLTHEERARQAQARFELAAVDAGAIEGQARQRERDAAHLDALATQLVAAQAALGQDVETRLIKLRRRAATGAEAVALARAALAGELLPGTGSEAWARMWEAARAYVESECHHSFPPLEPGAICPLCHQQLDESARARFERFDQHVQGTLERELVEIQAALGEELGRIEDVDFKALLDAPGLALIRDELPELAQRVTGWVAAASSRAAALMSGEAATGLGVPPSEAIRELAAGRKEDAVRQRSLVDVARLDELRREVAELAARELLEARWAEIEEWHATLKTIDSLKVAHTALGTTALSNKQAELAKDIVTDELRRRVRGELDALGFSHLKVDLSCRTDKGSTLAKMALDGAGAGVVDVLSESEQRGCALAFFLAEGLTSASTGGVVFDDPATSLDVERVDHIARRIVDLAATRQQVIVFTHNVVFAWCLQAAAESAGIGFGVRPIVRMGDKVGIVRPDEVWPGERLKARLKRLRNTLEQLEGKFRNGDLDYEVGAKLFACDIREAWERAIEEELFQGVVMRFQRDVKTLKIRDVEVTTAQTREIYEGMTETSPFHHEPALAKPVPKPTPEQLRAFFARIESFCEPDRALAVKHPTGPAA